MGRFVWLEQMANNDGMFLCLLLSALRVACYIVNKTVDSFYGDE